MSALSWHLLGVIPYVVIATALWGLGAGAVKDAVEAGTLPARLAVGRTTVPTTLLAYVAGFGVVVFAYGCVYDRSHVTAILGDSPYSLLLAAWVPALLLVLTYRRIRRATCKVFQAPCQRDQALARYQLLVEHISDLVSHHDLEGRYEWLSPSTRQCLGYEPSDLVGTDPYHLVHPDDADRVRAEGLSAIREGLESIAVSRYRIQKKDGTFVWFESLMEPIRNASGEIVRVQVTSRDVTERQAFEDELHRRAHHDPLTGLANRVLFTLRLDAVVEFAELTGGGENGFAVLYLDLNRFKAVNDTLGHAAGDELLVEVARRLRTSTRALDTVARIGGDEFAVLIEDADVEDAAVQAAKRIREALREPFHLAGRTRSLSASIGIAVGRPSHASAGDVLREADLAAYEAKADGRDGWALFTPVLREASDRRRKIEADLERAICENELVVAYQPIIQLDSGKLHGVEALVRWDHPELGMISPESFLGVAEETGLVVDLDHWVMAESLRQLGRWEREVGRELNLKVAVNCSAIDIHDPQFAWGVRSLLDASPAGRGNLVVEITESLLVDDPLRVAGVLQDLTETAGVEFSMDDFGTGYSSLSVVHSLPVSKVKIDQAFVRRMHEDGAALGMVKAVIGFARTMDTRIVAEGIETPRQLIDLRALGCEYGQGYLFAKPLRPEQLGWYLQQGGPWLKHWSHAPVYFFQPG